MAVTCARALLVAALAGCAPGVDGPVEHQRAIDREDGDRLAVLIAQLPGVVATQVVLHHAARDPLALSPATPAVLGVVIATDDAAAPDELRAAAIRLGRALAPELGGAVAIEVVPVVHRPRLAKVGPFWVEDTSQRALRATLVLACLAIAALAGLAARARRYRRGSKA
ncbi:MAG TPA: hypothetical protein VGC42_12270, partial [Kofleriaceae bacterium]